MLHLILCSFPIQNRFGVLRADVPAGFLLQRSALFTDTGRATTRGGGGLYYTRLYIILYYIILYYTVL